MLLQTNTINDRLRDQYIVPNIDNHNDDNYALCQILSELRLYRIYPLLIQWKSSEYEQDFELNCPLFANQPQFVHKVLKYDALSIPDIAYAVSSDIHRNSMNPARYQSINYDCLDFDSAAQAFGTRNGDELWMISGVVDIPTPSPTTDP